jgi:hypothetical protein
VVNICTASFDINKFYILRARCIHVGWISEQTAIISRYSIKLILLYLKPRLSVFRAPYGLSLYVEFRLIVVFEGLNKVM